MDGNAHVCADEESMGWSNAGVILLKSEMGVPIQA
jgi:hypothetical protein